MPTLIFPVATCMKEKSSFPHIWNNEYNVVRQFESVIAQYAGSNYGIAVDSCTAAIFLSLSYCYQNITIDTNIETITIPKHTYPSVPMEIIHAGFQVCFEDIAWKGCYQLEPLNIFDSAKRFTKDMYIPNSLYCLSFHYKKHLPIGRGGMILTDDHDAVNWLRCARYMGRHEGVPLDCDEFELCGWNLYMDPPRAARGLTLFSTMNAVNPDLEEIYPDLSKKRIFHNLLIK